MSQRTPPPPPPARGDEPQERAERLPVMQEVFDNTWFLFLVSGVVVLVSYLIWALVDLLNVPVAP